MSNAEAMPVAQMSVAQLHAELRPLAITDRLTALIVRDLEAAERRTSERGGDVMKARWTVLLEHGLATRAYELTRRGGLFVAYVNRAAGEEIAHAA